VTAFKILTGQMNITLKSASLTAVINSSGAEICSVKNKNNTEFMWQADKNVWARHAPVLFPIVGKLKDNQFIYENTAYSLSQHGFARDLEFDLIAENSDACVFRLTSNDETKKNYPFGFIFEIKYQLTENTLITSYTVKNPAAKKLYFSVGAHPAFNCALFPDEKFEDCFLEFESDHYEQTKLQDGLLSNTKAQLKLKDKKLFLASELFENDALVFENNQINKITLASVKSSRKIILECTHWPFFGIWSKKQNRQFVCLEPWYGIADNVSHDRQLINKKGILSLQPGEEFTCSFSISFL